MGRLNLIACSMRSSARMLTVGIEGRLTQSGLTRRRVFLAGGTEEQGALLNSPAPARLAVPLGKRVDELTVQRWPESLAAFAAIHPMFMVTLGG